MADVKWIKITTDIFDDEKILLIESLPDSYAIIVVWFKLLCLAGKQNNSGVFMLGRIAYTDKMLATIFRMKESTVNMALQTFEQFGMIEIVDGVITIPNWGKHQNLEQLEQRRQYQREYQKAYRQRQKELAAPENDENKCLRKHLREPNVNSPEEDIDKEKEEDKEYIEPPFGPQLQSAFDDWLKYKKERREGYKETGLRNLIGEIKNNAAKYGEGAVAELIRYCMASNWRGIIFDRLKEQPSRQQKPQASGVSFWEMKEEAGRR